MGKKSKGGNANADRRRITQAHTLSQFIKSHRMFKKLMKELDKLDEYFAKFNQIQPKQHYTLNKTSFSPSEWDQGSS